MITTDTLIECQSCGYIASEHEFGGEGELLRCPQCKDTANLWDYDFEVLDGTHIMQS